MEELNFRVGNFYLHHGESLRYVELYQYERICDEIEKKELKEIKSYEDLNLTLDSEKLYNVSKKLWNDAYREYQAIPIDEIWLEKLEFDTIRDLEDEGYKLVSEYRHKSGLTVIKEKYEKAYLGKDNYPSSYSIVDEFFIIYNEEKSEIKSVHDIQDKFYEFFNKEIINVKDVQFEPKGIFTLPEEPDDLPF
ncbi:hypothetical protein [Marixanthomonas ophiurae]|uniref:Uncharacterized protein n=1 Tax=Marixanthomonas ophiurae TaxID=387659 RepID=A0A3E1QDY2_9FLAO|nr:hypothetical protein [Marixanthomonas ophiurae]MAT90252.1 hypothetical protein [Flavobacteriaceae bacterium]RFN60369.1 hypothetical protein DZ858_10115 [Marixanthomonas ophiurae]|tara:strand:- start:4716 stop:5291 length:576 start_codon:yes stop_codon:yes gene_type:complete